MPLGRRRDLVRCYPVCGTFSSPLIWDASFLEIGFFVGCAIIRPVRNAIRRANDARPVSIIGLTAIFTLFSNAYIKQSSSLILKINFTFHSKAM